MGALPELFGDPGGLRSAGLRARISTAPRQAEAFLFGFGGSGGRQIPSLLTAVDDPFQPDSAEATRKDRLDNALAEAAADAEGAAEKQVRVEARSAGVDAPPAVGGDGAFPNALPLGVRAVAVGEGRVAAAEVGVALAGGGVCHALGDGDRVHHLQRVPERVGLAQHRHGLAVAQVGVDVHQANLAPEERGQFSAPEGLLRTAPVGYRPVHQPHAVREEQMVADEAEMMLGLLVRE